MEKYVRHLQNQSFTTNFQALNCAAALGMKLQRRNVTTNVYNLCHVSLKQFSVEGRLFWHHLNLGSLVPDSLSAEIDYFFWAHIGKKRC